jgi:type IV pilus assembly protein PilW
MQNKHADSKGFTIIELMLALSIFMIVVSAIYATYLSQQKSHLVQEQVASIQQTLRAAMFTMERDIRMAGYSMTPLPMAGVGIIEFGEKDGTDNDGDGTVDETDGTEHNLGLIFAYMTLDGSDGYDNDNNGTVDDETDEIIQIKYSKYKNSDGQFCVGRGSKKEPATSFTFQPIAENIDFFGLLFLDSNGKSTDKQIDVRSIRITMVARSDRKDLDYSDTHTYKDIEGNVVLLPPNDHYRRRILSTVVKCRNL